MKIISKLVWLGLGLLAITGLMLFLIDPQFYSNSNKFLAKMTIVFILLINGIIFHLHHIPFLQKILNKHLSIVSKEKFRRSTLLISGVISFLSWSSALILGALRNVSLNYFQIITIYFCFVFFGAGAVLIIKHLILPENKTAVEGIKDVFGPKT